MFPMRKRLREEDEEAYSHNTADAHKKPRTLAFRTSPTARHHPLSSQTFPPSPPRPNATSNMTPPESSEDEHGHGISSNPPPPSPEDPCDANDHDMDMVDAQPSISPSRCDGRDITVGTPPRPVTINVSLETPPRESHESAHGGRVPTPRWAYFRSKDISMDLGDVVEDDLPDGPINSQLEWNHRALLRRRRLPSPIGEDFAMISSSSSEVAGVSAESSDTLTSQGRAAILMDQTGMQTDPTLSDRSQLSTPGRTMLSMGFRANCEKCRARVPGHYNHVIRT